MIHIPKSIYDEMIAHALKGYPNEACGILGGAAEADGVSAARVFSPMRNMDESSVSYFMDPKEQLSVFKKMREAGLDLVGIFHSHVASEAYPSRKDARLAFYPDASYLIVSLSDKSRPNLRSFKIREEKIQEEDIRLE